MRKRLILTRIGRKWQILIAAGLLVWGIFPLQARAVAPLKDLPGGAVAGIVNAQQFRLHDGRMVRLAGIGTVTPRSALPQNWAEQAQKRLAELLKAGVRLKAGAHPQDRYQRWLAHAYSADNGLWVQGDLVSRGLAWVESYAGQRQLIAELLTLEADARNAGRGVWAEPRHLMVRAGASWSALESFRIVEGVVVSVTERRNRLYVNFGEDWREDFTIRIDRRYRRAFRARSLDLLSLAGRRVRVRGWIHLENGPMIRLTHPEPLEVLP